MDDGKRLFLVTFFESLLVLLAVAILLLQVARRLRLPYPGMLAAAGVAVAAIPGAPTIPITPETAMALFIAPILVDAAYDFPLGAARRLMVPLIVYAVIAVLVTALLVAGIGWWMVGLPFAAALTLGAIVAPPDAAAATAVLSNLPVARRVEAVLKGESLFNDATSLLLFSVAVTIQSRGGFDSVTAIQLGLAVPGGILFGIAYGFLVRRLEPFVENTVAGTLMQFLHAFATWAIAEHLHLSAVLATVASAMTMAASANQGDGPRMRVHSFAVWTTVVFLLNVVAFLLMGMQARTIVSTMDAAELQRALGFAGVVIVAVIVVRLVIAFVYRQFAIFRHKRGTGPAPVLPAESFLVGWTGMRGLVTLATAFALPRDFPERDLIVLTAFSVVLATLVIQGVTLGPFIRLFRLNRENVASEEFEDARVQMAEAALARLDREKGDIADALRVAYRDTRDDARKGGKPARHARHNGLVTAAVLAERNRLEELRRSHAVGTDTYLALQEDLDWKQLAVLDEYDRRIDES